MTALHSMPLEVNDMPVENVTVPVFRSANFTLQFAWAAFTAASKTSSGVPVKTAFLETAKAGATNRTVTMIRRAVGLGFKVLPPSYRLASAALATGELKGTTSLNSHAGQPSYLLDNL